MQQQTLWNKQEIVKDPKQIKAYLALCMRILTGGKNERS